MTSFPLSFSSLHPTPHLDAFFFYTPPIDAICQKNNMSVFFCNDIATALLYLYPKTKLVFIF